MDGYKSTKELWSALKKADETMLDCSRVMGLTPDLPLRRIVDSEEVSEDLRDAIMRFVSSVATMKMLLDLDPRDSGMGLVLDQIRKSRDDIVKLRLRKFN
jgi:hypothetical protein